jgi:integrase
MLEKLPRRYSTASKYRSWIVHHIKPRWGDYPIVRVKPPVEEWIEQLELAPMSKGHVRTMMHILFRWAMKWELIEVQINPMSLVHVEGSSKRMRDPVTLTVEQFHKVLEFVKEPFRIMCIVAICLGLRASELVGLQWNDFDWENLNVAIQRGGRDRKSGRSEDAPLEESDPSGPGFGVLAVVIPARSASEPVGIPQFAYGQAVVALGHPADSPRSGRRQSRTRTNRLAHIPALPTRQCCAA